MLQLDQYRSDKFLINIGEALPCLHDLTRMMSHYERYGPKAKHPSTRNQTASHFPVENATNAQRPPTVNAVSTSRRIGGSQPRNRSIIGLVLSVSSRPSSTAFLMPCTTSGHSRPPVYNRSHPLLQLRRRSNPFYNAEIQCIWNIEEGEESEIHYAEESPLVSTR